MVVMLLVITKKWQNLNEIKFEGLARLVGEVSEGEKEYLVWQFFGDKDEAERVFKNLIVRIEEVVL